MDKLRAHQRELKIDLISVPREGDPSLSLSVTGEGVTIEVGDVIISRGDLNRIELAFRKWNAATTGFEQHTEPACGGECPLYLEGNK